MALHRPKIIKTDGYVDFISLRGVIQPLRETVQEITRAGVDGHSYRKAGKHGAPFTLQGARDIDSICTSVDEYSEAYAKFVGVLCSILDDRTELHVNCMCLDVTILSANAITASAGGLEGPVADTLLVSVWSFQNTVVPS